MSEFTQVLHAAADSLEGEEHAARADLWEAL